MKPVFLLNCAFAFENLSNDLKGLIAVHSDPFSEMKMRSLWPKMPKNRVYEFVKTPRQLWPFEVFKNAATGRCLATDENGRLKEDIDLDLVNEDGETVAEYLNLESAGYMGRTPAWIVARRGHTETVKFLAEQKVDLGHADDEGVTPVSIAAMHGHTETVKFLAKQDVDLKQADYEGVTPVSNAAMHGRTETVKFLAEQDVDLERADKQGVTPIWNAAWKGHTETVKFLVEKNVKLGHANARYTPVWIASASGRTGVVEVLAAQKVDLERADDDEGLTPLLVAALNGHEETVKLLLEKIKKLNENILNSDDIAMNLRDDIKKMISDKLKQQKKSKRL